MQVGLVTRSAVGAARPHQNFMPLCRGALVRCRGCAASTLLAWVDDTAAPTKAWCRVWCKTKCNKLSKPSHPNRSQPSSLLHGMQGVSGSNPLGSIERTQAWPGFFNVLVHPRQGVRCTLGHPVTPIWCTIWCMLAPAQNRSTTGLRAPPHPLGARLGYGNPSAVV
jgi:hypothetical protein